MTRDSKTPAEIKESDGNHHQQMNDPLLLRPPSNNSSTTDQPTLIAATTTADDDHQVTGMEEEEEFTDIFNVLSNIELHPTLPAHQQQQQAFISSSRNIDNPRKKSIEKAESSGQKPKSNIPEIPQIDDEDLRRDSKRRKADHRPRKSRSAELHNMSERIRRDRIRRKMKTLQDLIPNCNTRDSASMLDDAIRYIKSLQNQVQIMSTGAGPMIQNPCSILQPAYQMLQFPPQFMPMSPCVGMSMGLFGAVQPPSVTPSGMPFALPGPPSQSSLAAAADSGMAAMMVAPGSVSLSVPCASHFSQVPVMNQGSVLPSQIILPTSSSSTSFLSDVPGIPDEEDNDSDSSQR